MSSEAIRPSTLDGIKRLAKSIKNEQGIQHIRALDIAAQSAGFQNFKHAQNVLKGDRSHQPTPPGPGHRVFLTAYWSETKSDRKGRETLTLWLDTLWSDLISPRQLKNDRALGRFRPEGPDHLVERYLVEFQSDARRLICAAARTLQFMDATKLRPSHDHSRVFPDGKSTHDLPGRDHYSIWYDRNSKCYLLADEPYEGAALSLAAERAAWSHRYGFTIAKPSWPGMYNPAGGSRIYLVADSGGIALEPLVVALDRLPEPIVEATWNGESAPAMPPFVSPGTLARSSARHATPAPKGLGHRIFVLDRNDQLYRIPLTQYSAMMDNSKDRPVPRFAAQRIRASGITVELIDKRPARVVLTSFFIIEFDERGLLKVDSLMQQSAAAFEAACAPRDRPQGNVLEVQSRFVASGGRWKPSVELQELLHAAALGRTEIPRL